MKNLLSIPAVFILFLCAASFLPAQQATPAEGSIAEMNNTSPLVEWFRQPGVTIYQDGSDALYGRSENRNVVSTVLDKAFQENLSHDVSGLMSGKSYFETAVVLDEDVRNRLAALFEKSDSVRLSSGQSLSWQESVEGEKVFNLLDPAIGLDCAFSLVRPDEDMIAMVRETYSRGAAWERWRQPLLEFYRRGYIIRVYRAENVFDPWKREISYSEALVIATFLGDHEQWLWGIHDGRGYLETVLEDAVVLPESVYNPE